MHQRTGRSRSGVGLFCVLVLILAGWSGNVIHHGVSGTAFAQSAFGFPEEVEVVNLVSGEVASFAVTPDTLILERVTIPAGGNVSVHQVSIVDLIFVEKGTLRLVDNLGLSSTLKESASVVLRAGASYEAQNAETAALSFIRLSLTTANDEATSQEAGVGAGGSETTQLSKLALLGVQDAPVSVFLNKATWGPGEDTGQYSQNGPVGVLMEIGVLTISSPSGLEGDLEPNRSVLLPADQELRIQNRGTVDATALLFGVIPTGKSAVNLKPTDSANADDSNASSTAAGAVLYQADASTGFDDWTKAAGWKTVNGMLVNDGSSDTVVFVAAPFDPTVPDYAVEIEMQWLRERTEYSTAGVVARGGSETGYWAGLLGPACNRDGAIMLWSGEVLPDPQTCNRSMEVAIEGSAIERDSEWHTYRIEVTGNVIRVMVDDIVVIETSDNRFLSTGQVGVWSTNAQVNIRRLTVIALGS